MVPKFGNNNSKLKDPRCLANTKQDKHKITSRHITVKLLKNEDKEKIPKATRGEKKRYTMDTGRVILIMNNFF